MDDLKLFVYIPGFEYKSLGPGFIDKITVRATEETTGNSLNVYTKYTKVNGFEYVKEGNTIFRTVTPNTVPLLETDSIGSPQHCNSEYIGNESCYRAEYGKFYDFITEHNSSDGSFTHVLTCYPNKEYTTKSAHFDLSNRDGLFVIQLLDPNQAIILEFDFYTLSFANYTSETQNYAKYWSDSVTDTINDTDNLPYIKIGSRKKVFRPYLLDDEQEEIKSVPAASMYYDISYTGNGDGTVDRENAMLYLPLQVKEGKNMPTIVKGTDICNVIKDSIFQDYQLSQSATYKTTVFTQEVTMGTSDIIPIDEGAISVLQNSDGGFMDWWGVNKVRVDKIIKESNIPVNFKNIPIYTLDTSNSNILWTSVPNLTIKNIGYELDDYTASPLILTWVFPTPIGHSFSATFEKTDAGVEEYDHLFMDTDGFFRVHNQYASYSFDYNFGLQDSLDGTFINPDDANPSFEADGEKQALLMNQWGYFYRKSYFNKRGGHTYNSGTLVQEQYSSTLTADGYSISSQNSNIVCYPYDDIEGNTPFDNIKNKYPGKLNNPTGSSYVRPLYTCFQYDKQDCKFLPNILGMSSIQITNNALPLKLTVDKMEVASVSVVGHQKELEKQGSWADNSVQQLGAGAINPMTQEPVWSGGIDGLKDSAMYSQNPVTAVSDPIWDKVFVTLNLPLVIDLNSSNYKYSNKSHYSVIPMYYTEKSNYKGNKSNIEEVYRWDKNSITYKNASGTQDIKYNDNRKSTFVYLNPNDKEKHDGYVKINKDYQQLQFNIDSNIKDMQSGFYVLHTNITASGDNSLTDAKKRPPFYLSIDGGKTWHMSSAGRIIFYWSGQNFPKNFLLNLTGGDGWAGIVTYDYYLRNIGLYKVVTDDTKNVNQVIMAQMTNEFNNEIKDDLVKRSESCRFICVGQPQINQEVFNIIYNNVIFPSAFCVYESFELFSNAKGSIGNNGYNKTNSGRMVYGFIYLPDDPKLHLEAIYPINDLNIQTFRSLKTGEDITVPKQFPCFNKPCRIQ